jgi:hypothetical protein
VEKAFLMVGLSSPDREYAKFLWLRDSSLSPKRPGNLITFRFKRIAFGVISSPFILAATIRHHLSSAGQGLGPEIDQNLYVDNLFLDCVSAEEAQQKAALAQQIFAQAKMRLCSFVSADPAALSNLPKDDILADECPSVLGLKWIKLQDILTFSLPQKVNEPLCRRLILASIASFFDPLGLACPLIVQGKLFFQSLWGSGKKWNDPLDPPHIITWQRIVSEWTNECWNISRRTVTDGILSLHIFCDAGPDAYGAVIYLRSELDGKVIISLVYPQSRLRPFRMKIQDGLTIPRLELLGLLHSCRLRLVSK